MNAETIREMEAGRELDAVVMELVMGYHREPRDFLPEHHWAWVKPDCKPTYLLPQFSRSNDAMQDVVDAMRERDFWWSASYKTACYPDDLNRPGYEVTFRCVYGGTRGTHTAAASTLAHATALAALLAVMGES